MRLSRLLLLYALALVFALGLLDGFAQPSLAVFNDQGLNAANSFTTPARFRSELLGGWLTGLTHTAETGNNRALVFVAGNEHIGQVDLLGSWQTGASHVAEAGSNRLLVFIAGNEQASSAPTITSVTYGGQALSKVNDISVGTTSTARVEIWILDEAGIAAASGIDFAGVWSATPDNPMYSHAFFGGVDQVSPTGSQETASTDSSTPNPIITAALADDSGDMVVTGAVAGDTGSYTPQNGFTLGNNQTAASTTTLGTAYKAGDGTGETPSMEHSGPNRQVIAAVELNAQAGAVATLTSVTYGGQALTKVNDVTAGTTFTARVEIWILNEAGIAAAAGSTFVPTWSVTPNLPMYSHAFFDEIDQATPTGDQDTASTNSSTPNPITTAALSTTYGDVVVLGVISGNSGNYTPQNGFSLGNEQIAASTTTLAAAYKSGVGTPETPSMLHSGPNRQAIAAVVLNH